jgi:hypothetical protein
MQIYIQELLTIQRLKFSASLKNSTEITETDRDAKLSILKCCFSLFWNDIFSSFFKETLQWKPITILEMLLCTWNLVAFRHF